MRWLLLAISLTLSAEVDMPRGLFRGTFQSVDASGQQGRIVARAADGTVCACAYDSRTYMEAGSERVTPQRLRTGDPIVIVADYRPGMRTCYARTLHVVAAPLPAPRRHVLPAISHSPPAGFRGDRTLSGRITKLDTSSFVIHTPDGDVVFALRPDTALFGEGRLEVNRHVSVRAGLNPLGHLEAYQISWAQLLRTQP